MTDELLPEDLNLRDIDNDYLAEIRTSLARSRTYLAAERTFAAWIRTGFAIAGAGVTLGTALKETESALLSRVIGGSLIFIGLYSFFVAWSGYKRVHDYINAHYPKHRMDIQSFTFNIFSVSLITAVLSIASVMGFWLMFS